MTDVVRRIASPGRIADGSPGTREWLVTNGLGGYASGTVSTLMTRRYHGLLIAALPAPFGRTYMLSHLDERLYLPDGSGRGHGRRLGGQRRRQARRDGGSCRVPPRDGPTRLALRARRAGPREAPASPVSTEHGARELSARRRAGADPPGDPAERPLPAARAAGEHAPPRSLRADGRQRSVRAARNRPSSRRFGFACTGPPPRFASPARRSVGSCIPWSGAGDTSPRGISGVPATSGSRSTRRRRPPSWPPPSPGRPWTRSIPRPRCASRADATAAPACGRPSRRRARVRRRSWSWRPTSSWSRPPGAWRTPR